MKENLQNSSFIFGFGTAFITFIILNLFCKRFEYQMFVTVINIGFPFSMYRGVVSGHSVYYFIWSGLIANFVIAILFSFVVGLLVKYFWSKFTSARLK